jgi:hypothetical protein
LLNYSAGKAFVDFYYRNSPAIADKIATSAGLRLITRIMLMPVIAVAYLIVHLGMLLTLLIFTALTFTAILACVMVRRRMRRTPAATA